MRKLNNDIHFYKKSLQHAENDIKIQHKSGKALKDIVGVAFENHRKRIWNYYGFTVSKDKYNAAFKIDWSINYNGKLIAFEEDKGHYLDSCFLERAISGFCKTINLFHKKGEKVPVLIIHSFTKYNKYSYKLEEDMDTRKDEIKDEIKKKLVYTTLVDCDRLLKQKWFSKNLYNSYSYNVNEELIIKDIKFILSLIPDS